MCSGNLFKFHPRLNTSTVEASIFKIRIVICSIKIDLITICSRYCNIICTTCQQSNLMVVRF
jgi:hypothetical protein